MSYIDSQGKVFGHLDRLAGWQAGQKPAPVTVEWDLSNVCSLGCQSCHFAHTHVAGPWATREHPKPVDYSHTGRFADFDLIYRVLPQMKAAGVQSIIWSGGGEPTLHPEFPQIVLQAHVAGLEQGLYTLGAHLPSIRSHAMQEYVSRLAWAVVSLDCPDAETYAAEKGVPSARFYAALEGVKNLVAHVPVVGVSFLLHAGNWRRTDAMLALSRSMGATYTTFRPTIETSPDRPATPLGDRQWITQALPTLRFLADEPDVEIDPERFLMWRDWTRHPYPTCYGIRLVTLITADGRMWVCPNRHGMPESSFGDLSKESFAAVWAKHPGQWTNFASCRAMCRLHLLNQTLSDVYTPRKHGAFL